MTDSPGRPIKDGMPSQVIRTTAYNAERTELMVMFTSGRGYVYSLVPGFVAAALEASASKGAFFNKHIRDRYPFRKAKVETVERASLREALRASQ